MTIYSLDRLFFLFFLFFFILFFNFTILYRFRHTSTWIHHRYTRDPHPEPSSLPVSSLWVIPVHQPQASSIVHQTWTGDSFHIWYYTCFNAILPNHPIWNQSVVPCPVLTAASWPAYRFLERQVGWSGIQNPFRIFHSLLWSTQSKTLA